MLMAKRLAVNTKNKTSRSKKTKKRLATKKAMLLAKPKNKSTNPNRRRSA